MSIQQRRRTLRERPGKAGRVACLFVATILWLPACGPSDPTGPERPSSQRYLFEVELENHDPRFPPYWLGLVVEADGLVSTWDRTAQAPGPCSHHWLGLIADECAGTFTEAELSARYPGKQTLLRLSPQELAARRQQAGELESGPFAAPNLACNDTGVLALVAFDHDPGTGRYTPLVVRLEGDQMRQNLSPGAPALTPWLLELAERVPFIRDWRVFAMDCRPD